MRRHIPVLQEIVIKPVILCLAYISEAHRRRIAEHSDFLYADDPEARRQAVREHGSRIDVVLTLGITGVDAEEIALMPRLRLICALGAGFECVDLAAAAARGIPVTNGAGMNDRAVADHAMSLLLASVRDLVVLDRLTRQGVWRTETHVRRGVSGKRLGVLGLGMIGMHIAKRAAAFDLEVGYHNRRRRDGTHWQYFASLLDLAEWADFLMIATPGGPSTSHLVSDKELNALGKDGYLVNISRGSVIDSEALARALKSGAIAGAGLDVYESEPLPPQVLLDCPNLILTPHLAGWSPEAIDATVTCFLDNIERLFRGQDLKNRVQ